MHGLFDRLRIGKSQVGPDPLDAAQARIGELTEALQGLVDLSDSSRSRGIAEVKRLLADARRVLASRPGSEYAAYAVRPHRTAGPRWVEECPKPLE